MAGVQFSAEGFGWEPALPEDTNTPASSENTGTGLEFAERRQHARQRVGSIAYVALGDDNGGIVLNVGEGGLSLAVVGVLDVEQPQRIRVQPPRSRDWIELAGEFAWVSESRKAAGIRFHELTGEAGSRIRNWISAESTTDELEGERGHDEVLHAPVQPAVPPAIPPLTWLKPKAPPAAIAQSAPLPIPAEVIKAKPRAEGRAGWVIPERAFLDLRTIAVPMALAATLSFVGGWFAARERAGNRITQVTDATPGAINDSTRPAEPAATNKDARRSSAAAPTAPPQKRLEPLKMTNRDANVPAIVASAEGRGTVASANPAPDRLEGTAAALPKGKESAAASSRPLEKPAVPIGSVSISFSDFPSMRVPPELRSQSARLGTKFQIGQLILRVEPEYPEKIRRQRIEGTVKLHAVIGRDGAVQSVALRSGPPLLAPLAMRAIREWQFEQTLLGGQSIETEEDITVVFRLTNLAIQSN